MTYIISARALTVSAFTFAATAISGCSFQSYGHGMSSAGANCDVAAAACHGQYGNSAYGGQYGHYQGSFNSSSLRGMHASGKTRYGTSYQTAGYVEQSYMQQPYMPMSYSQPSYSIAPAAPQVSAPSYNVEMFQPTTSQTTSYAAPANCPAGTTAQSDGTCLQGSGISTSSYSSTYSTPTYSTQSYSTPSYSGSYITSGATENCPAGTTSSSDGTCLMGADTSYQSSTYSGPTYGSSNSVGNGVAPALSTHSFNDYNWGSNDTSWGSNSYVSPGTRSVDAPYNSPSTDITPSYLPYRK